MFALVGFTGLFHYRRFAINLLYRIQPNKNEEKLGFTSNNAPQLQP